MLNQTSPKSNILLKRETVRGKPLETIVEDTSGDDWMKPFADHLGVIPDEFRSWRDIIASEGKCLLLVEGDIDIEYVNFLRQNYAEKFPVSRHVKVLAYGGRGSLKNPTIVSFVKQITGRVFITFDLDAKGEVQRHLEQIGLEEKKDFLAVGKNKAGKKAIEGLLPERIFQAVYGRETELVSALADVGDDRKSARSNLKWKLLEEFKSHTDYSDDELKDFEMLGKTINKALSC